MKRTLNLTQEQFEDFVKLEFGPDGPPKPSPVLNGPKPGSSPVLDRPKQTKKRGRSKKPGGPVPNKVRVAECRMRKEQKAIEAAAKKAEESVKRKARRERAKAKAREANTNMSNVEKENNQNGTQC